MKKVLIITYYWPPSGGAGVQRWLKFVKYLRNFGWEPIVYTPSNGEMPVEDNSLQKDLPLDLTVLKTEIWEPYSIYKKFIGQKKSEKINTGFLTERKKPRLAEKIAVWVRGNFFIPDARKFWVNDSVKYLSNYLDQHPVDAIISSGPPHSMHLIAMRIKGAKSIPWIADFRDPWTTIDYYNDLMLSRFADAKHKKLEREVLQNADAVLAVSPSMTNEFKTILQNQQVPYNPSHFYTLPNGFDEEDQPDTGVSLDEKFSIAHIGTLVRSRNPQLFWHALAELCTEIPGFSNNLDIKLVGKVDVNIMNAIQSNGLEKNLNKIDYLPHDKILNVQRTSHLLLLIINNTVNAKGILTGKLFEYLASSRPILGIGPEDGDAAKILAETHTGIMIDFENKQSIKNYVAEQYQNYLMLPVKPFADLSNSNAIQKYTRKNLTKQLADILNAITNTLSYDRIENHTLQVKK